MEYKANFNSDGCRFINPITSNNKFELLKQVRNAALEERLPNANSSWYVEDENGYSAFEGRYISHVGIRYSIFNYKTK